jgi:hypothetical protein
MAASRKARAKMHGFRPTRLTFPSTERLGLGVAGTGNQPTSDSIHSSVLDRRCRAGACACMRVVCHLLVASPLVPLATWRDAIDRPVLKVRRPSVRADGDPRWRASNAPLARLFAVLEDLDALLPSERPRGTSS